MEKRFQFNMKAEKCDLQQMQQKLLCSCNEAASLLRNQGLCD